MTRAHSVLSLAFAAVLSAACDGAVAIDGGLDGPACADRIQPRVILEPAITDPGDYLIELTVDGEFGMCGVELTGNGSEGGDCSTSAFNLNQTQGPPPSSPTDILGVTLTENENPAEATIKVVRDGAVLAQGVYPFEDQIAEVPGDCMPLSLTATVEISE